MRTVQLPYIDCYFTSALSTRARGRGSVPPRISRLLQTYPSKITSKLSTFPPTNKLIPYRRQLEILATALILGVCSRSLIEAEATKRYSRPTLMNS